MAKVLHHQTVMLPQQVAKVSHRQAVMPQQQVAKVQHRQVVMLPHQTVKVQHRRAVMLLHQAAKVLHRAVSTRVPALSPHDPIITAARQHIRPVAAQALTARGKGLPAATTATASPAWAINCSAPSVT